MKLSTYIKEIWRGKDLYRIFMNAECSNHTLRGKTADVGSGAEKASYHRFFGKEEGSEIVSLDRQISPINFEHDRLPYPDKSIDVILVFNVFEHIYNYQTLILEIKRVLKTRGRVYGATPFLVGFHPDPADYWRFTSCALESSFKLAGFTDIKIKTLGKGPFIASFFQTEFMFPGITKMIILPFLFFLDFLFLKFKPNIPSEKFALGLFFTFRKQQ